MATSNLKTLSGVEIKVTPNKRKRTFTIRKNGSKYRTYAMPADEFNSATNFWTGSDWADFLKTNDYYLVN